MSVIRNSVPALIAVEISIPPARFDGPLQVRTSALAILTASCATAAVLALAVVACFAATFSTWQTADWSAHILKMAIPSYLFLITVLVTVVPAAAVVGTTHALARNLQRMRVVDYAAIGAGVSLVAASITVSFVPAPVLLPTVVMTGALMGGVYRRFAGLEPLPEPGLAADPRHLAGEHHRAPHGSAV